MRFRTPTADPDNIPTLEPEESDTMYALVRRSPHGGYAVCVGLVEQDFTPEISDSDERFITILGAIRFAQSAGFYSIHPECYPPRSNKIVKGV